LVLLAGLITSAILAFIGFHEDRLGGTKSRNNRLVANPVGIPVERPL
jgi:hypothetical protein